MIKIKKWLSYLYPQTESKVKSEFSGILEITWENGKRVLNTANTNYSFGALHKVLRFGIGKVDLNKVNHVLLLGLGGGSAVHLLRGEFGYNRQITAVDIDPVILDIAGRIFNTGTDSKTDIVCQDACLFMKKTKQLFDLIIIDLFIDSKVPVQFYGLPFWETVVGALSSGGSVIFNAGLSALSGKEVASVAEKFGAEMSFVFYENVERFNTVVVGTKKKD